MVEYMTVIGCESTADNFEHKELSVKISKDKIRRWISVSNGNITFSFSFEPLEKYLKEG